MQASPNQVCYIHLYIFLFLYFEVTIPKFCKIKDQVIVSLMAYHAFKSLLGNTNLIYTFTDLKLENRNMWTLKTKVSFLGKMLKKMYYYQRKKVLLSLFYEIRKYDLKGWEEQN